MDHIIESAYLEGGDDGGEEEAVERNESLGQAGLGGEGEKGGNEVRLVFADLINGATILPLFCLLQMMSISVLILVGISQDIVEFIKLN